MKKKEMKKLIKSLMKENKELREEIIKLKSEGVILKTSSEDEDLQKILDYEITRAKSLIPAKVVADIEKIYKVIPVNAVPRWSLLSKMTWGDDGDDNDYPIPVLFKLISKSLPGPSGAESFFHLFGSELSTVRNGDIAFFDKMLLEKYPVYFGEIREIILSEISTDDKDFNKYDILDDTVTTKGVDWSRLFDDFRDIFSPNIESILCSKSSLPELFQAINDVVVNKMSTCKRYSLNYDSFICTPKTIIPEYNESFKKGMSPTRYDLLNLLNFIMDVFFDGIPEISKYYNDLRPKLALIIYGILEKALQPISPIFMPDLNYFDENSEDFDENNEDKELDLSDDAIYPLVEYYGIHPRELFITLICEINKIIGKSEDKTVYVTKLAELNCIYLQMVNDITVREVSEITGISENVIYYRLRFKHLLYKNIVKISDNLFDNMALRHDLSLMNVILFEKAPIDPLLSFFINLKNYHMTDERYEKIRSEDPKRFYDLMKKLNEMKYFA